MQLAVDGKRVHAATGGRVFDPVKPAMVFLHGAGMEHSGWMQPARWFAYHGWSVLAPDLPGHGRSDGPPLTAVAAMAAWIERLLTAAGVERAALVGHSMGGAIALEAAPRLGAQVTHLGLIGTAAAIPVGAALMTAAREQPGQAYDLMTTWAHSPAARIGANPTPGLWMTGATRAVFGRSAPDVLAIDLAACAAWAGGPAAAGAVTCPSVVIAAEHDVMTPAKQGVALAALIPGARSVIIPKCGHMIMAEAPGACLDALIAAFGKV